MTHSDQLAALVRDVHRLKLVATVAIVGGIGVATVAAVAPAPDARFGTVTAERINVVEPDGLFRAVLTNGARTPGPMKVARVGAPEGTRNFPFAGLIVYDVEGQEQGGYGTGAAAAQGSVAVNTLDWPGGSDGGFGEAIATYRRVDKNGVPSTGIQLNDRPPVGEDPSSGADRRRIKLQSVARDAEILMADAQGRDRIRMRVGRDGDASIEILDAAGRSIFRAPDK